MPKVNTSICAICDRKVKDEVVYPYVPFCAQCRQLLNLPTLVSVVGQLREDVAVLKAELKETKRKLAEHLKT